MADRLKIGPGETLEVLERTPEVLVVRASYAPNGIAPPAHYHPEQEEHFEVVDGELRVEVAGVERRLRAGETLNILRGTSHRMWNPHSLPALARWETRPAGRTERWFIALAALQGTDFVDSAGRPKALPFAALAQEYRDTFRLASRPQAIARIAVSVLAHVARAVGRDPAEPVGDIGAVSGPLAGLAFVSGVAAGLVIADAPYPRPGADAAAIRKYFNGNACAARISIVGQVVSAASLARFGASVATLADASGSNPRSLSTIARIAGATAGATLAASAASSAALTFRPRRNDAATSALHRRAFTLGGPAHTAAFGALVGCLSLAGRRAGALPRALTNAGLVSATVSVSSPIALIVKPAVWLIPAGRFSGLIVCGIAGRQLSS
jgi:mannose-6-phosphate isomerase-like protein (cupin superfamily)